MYGDGAQLRTFTHVRDGVRGLMAEPAAVGEVVNIGSSEAIAILDLAVRIKRMTGSRSEIVRAPYEQAYGEGFEDIRNRVPDLEKARRLIGYEPSCPLDVILRETIEYTSQTSRAVVQGP